MDLTLASTAFVVCPPPRGKRHLHCLWERRYEVVVVKATYADDGGYKLGRKRSR
jgi:hypothetical protein